MMPAIPLSTAELENRHNGRPGFGVANEYDVQAPLRAIARLHFDDVRPEERNPSYAGVHSRSDLLLKPERVIIETKMTRKSLGKRAPKALMRWPKELAGAERSTPNRPRSGQSRPTGARMR
jgi:REase_DpnII-MboI